MNKIIDAGSAKLAGLQIDHMQKMRNGQVTVKHWEWFLGLTKEERDGLRAGKSKPAIDDRFVLINTFKLTVPANYDHATKLASFSRKNIGKFAYYNDDITDRNFSRATTIITPGRKFEVKIFQVKVTVSSMDCLTFLRGENAVLVGAQGLALAWDEAKDEIPRGRWTVSFDEETALFKNADGDRRVPGVRRYSGGGWGFRLGDFGNDWLGDACLLGFRDLSA